MYSKLEESVLPNFKKYSFLFAAFFFYCILMYICMYLCKIHSPLSDVMDYYFKLLQLSSWLKGPKEWHMQEAVSGCLVQVDFQYCSQLGIFHLSELASWTIAAPVSGKWNRLCFFCCCFCFGKTISFMHTS